MVRRLARKVAAQQARTKERTVAEANAHGYEAGEDLPAGDWQIDGPLPDAILESPNLPLDPPLPDVPLHQEARHVAVAV